MQNVNPTVNRYRKELSKPTILQFKKKEKGGSPPKKGTEIYIHGKNI